MRAYHTEGMPSLKQQQACTSRKSIHYRFPVCALRMRGCVGRCFLSTVRWSASVSRPLRTCFIICDYSNMLHSPGPDITDYGCHSLTVSQCQTDLNKGCSVSVQHKNNTDWQLFFSLFLIENLQPVLERETPL